MPQGDKSLMESIMAQTVPEEVSAVNILFDTENYKRLKMISEIPPSLMYTLVTMSVLQRRYSSKVLKQWIEEFLSMQKSRDRQGIIELVEILLGIRIVEKGEED